MIGDFENVVHGAEESPQTDITKEDPRQKLENDTKRVSAVFEKFDTISDLVEVLVKNPDYVYRVRYDAMDNKIVARLGSMTGYYSEVRYNIGNNEGNDW